MTNPTYFSFVFVFKLYICEILGDTHETIIH